MSSIALADGEYFIWSSTRSRSTKITPRQLAAFVFVGLYAFGSLAALLVAAGPAGGIGSLVSVILLVVFMRWYRRRPAFFMTNQHLFDAGVFIKQKIPLASIRGCERYVQEVYTRYGVERILTDKVVLLSAGQSIHFGPVADFEGLWELIHHGVLGNSIQISALPSLDGGPAPAEKRNDILLVLSTKTDGDEYGPLFVGPTKIIRFTEKLPSLLERILLSVGAAENTPDEMEHHMQQLVRHPHAGHSTILERDLVAPTVDGNMLTLTSPERVIKMELRPADVTRTAAFVRALRPAHPMR